MKRENKAIDTAGAFLRGEDMSVREEKVVEEVAERTGFLPERVIWRSDYYGSGKLGAVHYAGEYKGSRAVLKIQGVKPDISEIFMISQFAAQNKSKIIRPPQLYATLPWEEKRGYEALIMEHVMGGKVVESGELQTKENVGDFFELYREYKRFCANEPWLEKPTGKLSLREFAGKLKVVSEKTKPENPYRRRTDWKLAEKALGVLEKTWVNTDWEFMHGHFSAEDLIRQGDEVVLFSNLFWKWKHPFYDAVFAYHWFMYSLASVKGIGVDQIEEQRNLWLKEIFTLGSQEEAKGGEILIKAALLERAMAGLLVDSFAYIGEDNPVAEYMVVSTRDQVRGLMRELKG